MGLDAVPPFAVFFLQKTAKNSVLKRVSPDRELLVLELIGV